MSTLGRYPVRLELQVLWGDMDALRHVNNAVYARWLEQARIAYFERLGLTGDLTVGPILARQTIDFRSPVTYPDRVHLAVTVERLGTTSIALRYRGTSEAQSGAVVVEGESVVVVFDYARGTKVPIGDDLRARIEALEAAGAETR